MQWIDAQRSNGRATAGPAARKGSKGCRSRVMRNPLVRSCGELDSFSAAAIFCCGLPPSISTCFEVGGLASYSTLPGGAGACGGGCGWMGGLGGRPFFRAFASPHRSACVARVRASDQTSPDPASQQTPLGGLQRRPHNPILADQQRAARSWGGSEGGRTEVVVVEKAWDALALSRSGARDSGRPSEILGFLASLGLVRRQSWLCAGHEMDQRRRECDAGPTENRALCCPNIMLHAPADTSAANSYTAGARRDTVIANCSSPNRN